MSDSGDAATGDYGQEVELELLKHLVRMLGGATVLDVGAERGEVTAAMLEAGAVRVVAFEPESANLAGLRARFGDEPRVTIEPFAITREDGVVGLRRASDSRGEPMSAFHTISDLPDGREVSWADPEPVQGRSLGSLVAAGGLPERIGVLKIDTEGNDLEVLLGMGTLDPDVVMIEHWLELPGSLGPCPWTTASAAAILEPRGFHHFVSVVHRGAFTVALWDEEEIPAGVFGNLVFIHDRLLERAIPIVLEHISAAARGAAESYEDQLKLLGHERGLQAAAAAERLALLDRLARERDIQAAAAEERLAVIERLSETSGNS